MAKMFRCPRALAIPLLMAIAMCSGEDPQHKGGSSAPELHSARVFGEKRKVKGIRNVGEVTPRLFRGGQANHQGFETLAKMGVEIVVDTRGNLTNSEGKEVRRHGMRYVAIPWHCPFPKDDLFVRFLRVLKENPNKKVFVHCRLGDDRTGMMVAAYRMAEGWSADEAMLEMKAFGFTRAHHLICPRLEGYERSFPKRLKKDPAFEGVRSLPPPTASR